MSLKTKFISATTLALSIGAFSIFTAAQETPKTDSDNQPKREWRGGKRDGFGKGFRQGGKRGGFGMRGFRELNLTDAQKEQFRQIREANRPSEELRTEIRTLHEAKRNGTLTADQQARLKTLRDQMRTQGEAVQQQFLAILTPEQRQQLEAKKAEMKQRWEERKQLRQQRKQQTPQSEDQDN